MSSRKSIRRSLSRFNPFSRKLPSRLAEAAGSDRQDMMEPLESRQMLFTLTVPGAPGTMGTVQEFFAYTIPYLVSPVAIGIAPRVAFLEDFNADDPADPGANPNGIPIGPGTTFAESFLTLDYTQGQLTSARLIREDPATQGANYLRFTMQGGESFSFRVAAALGSAVSRKFSNPQAINIEIGGQAIASSIDPSTMTIELRFQGQVVTTSLLSAFNSTALPGGGRTYRFVAPPNQGFDEVRFIANAAQGPFSVDNVSFTLEAGNAVGVIDGRTFGANIVFRAPAGATIQVLDLYGRDMISRYADGTQFLAVGSVPNAQPPMAFSDPDGDGVPDYNDGIGKIITTGTDGNSSFTIVGGKIATPAAGLEALDAKVPIAYFESESVLGIYDDLQAAGFGFRVVPNAGGQPRVDGLPPGPGSVIIGSPWVRPLNNYNPGGLATAVSDTNFSRPDQGLFVTGGGSLLTAYVHGILHGTSQFTGFASNIIVGYMVGSVSVAGDLGLFVSASDAGMWTSDDGLVRNTTGGTLVVGRTLGNYSVAGRNDMSVTVIGDINSPTTRPARDSVHYTERERFNLGTTIEEQTIANILARTGFSQSIIFADNFQRNDSILGSEWIGSLATSVQVTGTIPQIGPDVTQTVPDLADVYSFAVDGTQDIVIQTPSGIYMRLMDQDGRTLAANQAPNPIGTNPDFTGIRYRPKGPGVIYLDIQGAGPYTFNVNGMAPTTVGMIRMGSGTSLTGLAVVQVLSGSVGSIRVGSGYVDGGGNDADTSVILNPDALEQTQRLDDRMAIHSMSINIPGNLYNITAGSDVGTPGGSFTVNVGLNFGNLVTGLSAVIGTGPREGDLHGTSFNVGGSIGMIDVRGAIGITQDVQPNPFYPVTDIANGISFRTGTRIANDPTLKGNIGMIRVGSNVGIANGGSTLQVVTPDNSTVGGFLVSQDLAIGAGDPYVGIYSQDPITSPQAGINFQLGINSDLRFFDTPQIDQGGVNDKFLNLITDQPLTLTDDSGATVQITLSGGTTPGIIRVVPIAGSLGVAIGRITVDLSGGAILTINGVSNPSGTDVISIGRIIITGSSAASQLNIIGTAEVDVWRIEQTGGTEFGDIANTSPRGDIVVADMVALNNLFMGTGDLGRTQVPAWGPQQLGIFLGITAGAGGAGGAGGPISVPAAVVSSLWNGDLYRPVNDTQQLPPGPWLDDIGSPVSPYLNGLIVRTGSVGNVVVGGAVGDVIVNDQTDGLGVLTFLTANADGLNLSGRPEGEGIFGTIFAARIFQVDIGSGLGASEQSPLATAGIIATDDIGSIVGGRVQGAYIKGNINAANSVAINADANFPTDGINSISLTNGGIYDKAYIGSMKLDSFWRGLYTGFDIDPEQYRGRITLLTGTDVNLFRSQVWANDIVRIDLNATQADRGFYDATLTHTRADLGTVIAKGYRNSTVSGNQSEFFPNQILVGQDIQLLTTYNTAGDIEDLTVDSLGHIVQMSANTITRSTIDADIELANLQTIADIRSSTITTGQLTLGQIAANIRSSAINVSGRLVNLTVAGEATNTAIQISGPDGRLELVRVRKLYTGSIRSAGPIDTFEVTEGDLNATLFTSKNQHGARGDIGLITAGRDIILDADIDGTITRMVAGRHIGDRLAPKPIVVHGDVTSIEIPNGQLYSDFRIDQSITSITIGAVSDVPGSARVGTGQLIAFGRIESAIINGDFGGKIISWSGGIGTVTINNGSLLPNAAVEAHAGDLVQLTINSGHLMGSVHADYILWNIQVNASADGIFGDLGINPALSQGNPTTDPLRNQLPPGVVADPTFQGPRITAGRNIGRITLSNGSIFEAFIYAGRAIGTISVNGDIRNDNLTSGLGTVIAAGSSIFNVTATGNIANTIVISGVRSFGNDNRPGGNGVNADSLRSGRIESVIAGGSGTNVSVTAGLSAGADGIYNTGDERVVLGTSYVRTVTFGAAVLNVSVFADSPTLTVSPGVQRFGTNFTLADGDLNNGSSVPGGGITAGVPFAFNLPGGITGTITFTGPGQAYYDNVGRRVLLVNTSFLSTLSVTANGTLTDFDIVTNDDASIGTLVVNAPMAGDSDIVIDAYAGSIVTGNFAGTGSIKVGMNLRSLTMGNFTGGSVNAAFWVRDITINGNFGASGGGGARIDAYAAGNIVINGVDQALINVERDLGSVTALSMNLAQTRTGGFLGSLTTGPLTRSRVSARDGIGGVQVNGSVSETSIQAGGDLGDDAAPGGTGFNADSVSSASIGPVIVSGNFSQSDVVAGLLRGPDGFFGTLDDSAAAGRSNIASVQIAGTQVGSNTSSQSYRVAATGIVGTVTVGGNIYTPATGANFLVQKLATRSNPLRVQDIVMSQDSQVWFAKFLFNQDIDTGTVAGSLTISEVRNGGLVLVPLVLGTDYTIQPSPTQKDSVVIRFSRAVTDRNLVPTGGIPVGGGSTAGTQDPALPGPGVFRFALSSSTFRAAVADARLQGNPALQTTADFSQDVFVGDAGDKLIAEVDNIGTTPAPIVIDMYAPADLDVVMDNNQTPDGQPDTNTTYTVRGAVGDHPDHGITLFQPAADTDIYRITLRAGQILRLGAMQGAASNAGQQFVAAAGGAFTTLPADTDRSFLIRTTGTYFIVISNNIPDSFNAAGIVPNTTSGVNDTGSYSFAVQVFDDADSGFGAATDSGNGTPVVNAPAALVFAGPNGVFQNVGAPGYDDLTEVAIGDYKFTLDAGPDGVRGTGDDVVSGSNASGITSVRRSNTSLTSTINSAIGPKGHNGAPGDFAPDADVFVLNNGQTIASGRTITVKVKLADIGADLGTFSRLTGRDFRGSVQFGLFDITNAVGVDDGSLIFSPTDFKSIAQKQQTLATQGPITYGYDANGDYLITFVTTGRIGGLATDPAKYAIYIQGVFNTDYTIEVTQNEATAAATVPQARQNVLIETHGGTVNWLEAGGLTTTLAGFSAATLGFTGSIGNLVANDYILTNLVAKLNSIFTSNGLNVVFSTNPADFEFQDYSTVFLSSSTDPISIFNTTNFGYSQHSDPFNADRNDDAAIFLPSFSQLGLTPSQSGADSFVLSLTAAVGRRAGELMGLRIEANDSVLNNPNSIMAANSITNASPNAAFLGAPARSLSTITDSVINSNFFLGQQNAFALLDKFLTP